MVNMNKLELFKLFIPALNKALMHEDDWDQFNVKGPVFFLEGTPEKQKEIETYLDQNAGKDKFLDSVAYYFDAKSHGFDEIDGVDLNVYKQNLKNEILELKKKI